MRRPIKKRRNAIATIKPDRMYNSQKVAKFINYVMLDGKRGAAEKIVYDAFETMKEKTSNPNPLEVFDMAMKNAGPVTEVRSRRIGGANYQVPREVRSERRLQLAMRWILEAARSKKGGPVSGFLADEIIAASNNEGAAVTKKVNTHKMADANKAFAHFSW